MGKKRIVTTTGDVAEELAAQEKATAQMIKGKKGKKLERARIYIAASYNNTTITLTDPEGNVLGWTTSGSLGFKGPKKATPFAASKVVSVISEKMKAMGVKEIEIFIKGIGGGRDSSIRSLANQGFEITLLKDVTPIPHNGPRPRKARRV